MILDQFDQTVLSAKGRPAEEIIQELYHKRIGKANAGKYLSGIRTHLKFKQRIALDETGTGLNEVITKADGSKTTKRMIVMSESDSTDPRRIMDLMGLDPLQWKVTYLKVTRNDWGVTMKLGLPGNEYPQHELNHQYKVQLTVKPLQDAITTDYVQEVFEGLEAPHLSSYHKSYKHKGLLLEFPIMDLHLGKLAWALETGQNYDLKIAANLYKKTVQDLLSKVHQINLPIEMALFPVGQDFFHTDTAKNTTTAGTPMDIDVRAPKMYALGVDLLFWTAELLRSIAPLKIIFVPGNHDELLGYCALYSLHSVYKNHEHVFVDLSPSPRKYFRWGNTLLGFSHGKEGKRIEHLMQQEAAADWGETLFHEWHLGDLHHEEAKEVGGVKIRRISSITATDAWHAKKGFMSVRMATAYLWDKEQGKQFTLDSNVMEEQDEI